MVSYCANPGCGKPLYYLREGRIYVFDASAGSREPGRKRERRLEHYWICGACAETLMLAQNPQGDVRIQPRPAAVREADERRNAAGSHLSL